MKNPFTESRMIKNPTKFFGRKDELHHIVNRLQNMQSVSIVGERRIGKSSLLYHLYQTGRERLGENYRFVYGDLQDVRNHSEAGKLFTNLLKELNVPFTPQETVQRNLIEFSETVEQVKESGQHVVLLFDEFEKLLQHRDAFPEDFFDQMRVLMNNGSLAIVTGSPRPLRDLCLDGKLSSPFYNVFSRIDLEEFTEDETADFLNANWGIDRFSEEELTFIVSYPQYCHPLILQIICYWIVENRMKQLSENALEKEIARDADNYFEHGVFNEARRRKGDLLKGGKEVWEMAKAIITKRLGG